MKKMSMISTIVVLAGMVAVSALSQTARDSTSAGQNPPPTSGSSPVSGDYGSGMPDTSSAASFAMKVADAGFAEVAMGQLAIQQARDTSVTSFARRMVQDHTKANRELKDLATKKNWTIPASFDTTKHESMMRELQEATNSDFDRKYMELMVDDHNKVVSMFQQYSKSGKDKELKSWVSKTLPTLQQHQKLAKQINDRMKSARQGQDQ
jgi:putative membrane protein